MLRSLVILVVLISTQHVLAEDPKPDDKSRVKEFAPGVRIDWVRGRVELDGRVVLRKGPLELFACSPHTREHESIITVEARPLFIFQALGLIGTIPGSPAQYDSKKDAWKAPSGAELRLSVRFRNGDVPEEIPLEKWLREVKGGQSPKPINWVFSGSQRSKDGFYADSEGTVVCVVDFDSALISVGQSHSADNELLWLEANTDAIPPIGTRCTLVIENPEFRKPNDNKITIDITKDGILRRDGDSVTPTAVRAWIESGVDVVIHAHTSLPKPDIDRALRSLDRAGIPRASYTITNMIDTPSTTKKAP